MQLRKKDKDDARKLKDSKELRNYAIKNTCVKLI